MLTIVTVRFWLFIVALIAATVRLGGLSEFFDGCLALTWGTVFIVVGLANIARPNR